MPSVAPQRSMRMVAVSLVALNLVLQLGTLCAAATSPERLQRVDALEDSTSSKLGGDLRKLQGDVVPCDCIGKTVGTILYNETDRGMRWKDVEFAIRRVTEGRRSLALRPTVDDGTYVMYALYKRPTLHNTTECGCDHYEFSGLPDVKAPHLNMTYTVRCCRNSRTPLPHENVCIMYKHRPTCGDREIIDIKAETTGICLDMAQTNFTPPERIDACMNNRRCGNPTEGGNSECNPGDDNCCPPESGACFPNHCAINKKSCGLDNGRGDLAIDSRTGANMCMHEYDCTFDESVCDNFHDMECFDECGPEY